MDADGEARFDLVRAVTQGAAGEGRGGSGQHWKGLRSLCTYVITGNSTNPELLARSIMALRQRCERFPFFSPPTPIWGGPPLLAVKRTQKRKGGLEATFSVLFNGSWQERGGREKGGLGENVLL